MIDLFQFMPEGQVSNSMERTSSIQADFNAVLATLEKLGQPSLTEMLIRNHGVHEPYWGVKLGNNACQCPEALAYLERSAQKGVIGKKRTL